MLAVWPAKEMEEEDGTWMYHPLFGFSYYGQGSDLPNGFSLAYVKLGHGACLYCWPWRFGHLPH